MNHLEELAKQLEAKTKQWQEQEFNCGKNDGQCGYDNTNCGSIAASPYYHAGYVTGIHERLLADNNVRRQDWDKWELIANVRDPRFPLSSPIEFNLIPKNSGELDGSKT